jgi:hypothetical protein
MGRAATVAEYNARQRERDEAIRRNASRRIKKLEPLPVPEKLGKPLGPVAYAADGTFEGRLNDVDECPEGCVVRWEELHC